MQEIAEYLTGSETARALGVSHKTVNEWADDGRIESVTTKLGRLYNPESVERLRAYRAGEVEG